MIVAGEDLVRLVAVIEELIDAHFDTIELALDDDRLAWQRHVGYLQDLQRAAQGVLASLDAT